MIIPMLCVIISSILCEPFFFFFSSRRRHTRWPRDWSSDGCSSDLVAVEVGEEPVGDAEAPDELVVLEPLERPRGIGAARRRAWGGRGRLERLADGEPLDEPVGRERWRSAQEEAGEVEQGRERRERRLEWLRLARPLAAELVPEEGGLAGDVDAVTGQQELEVGLRRRERAPDVGREAQLGEHRLGGRQVARGGEDGGAEREDVAVIDVVEAGVVVGDVQDAEAAAREERARDDAAELGADDTDVVEPLGRGGTEGLRYGSPDLELRVGDRYGHGAPGAVHLDAAPLHREPALGVPLDRLRVDPVLLLA